MTGKDDGVSFTELLDLESHLTDVRRIVLDQKVIYNLLLFSPIIEDVLILKNSSLTIAEEDKARRRWKPAQTGQDSIT